MLLSSWLSHHAEVINREVMSAHTFDITVMCGMTQCASALLRIMVSDENDITPTFLGSSYLSLSVAEDAEVRGGCG